jgi:hypothetical protein
MLLRLILWLVLAGGVGAFAEPVGDFAPLEVGNLWEYECVSYSSSMCGMHSGNDSLLVRMQLTGSEVSGDTLLFYIRTHKTGRSIDDTTGIDTAEMTEPETTFFDFVVYDTLYEINGVIETKKPWRSGPVPVCNRHSMDTETTEAPCELTDTSGTWEVWCRFGSFETDGLERYRVDTGLVYLEFLSHLHGVGGKDIYELISFTRAASVATAPALHHRVRGMGTASGNPSTLLQLPHLSIINGNGSVVNLLGRAEGRDRSHKVRGLNIRAR